MSTKDFLDRPPQLDRVGPYDQKHIKTDLRLLDADEEGADWQEVVSILFGIDPKREPERAKIVHDSHLARAKWMTVTGYQHLLQPPMQ